MVCQQLFFRFDQKNLSSAYDTYEGIQIYSPYYSETTVDNDGVGKYHDRIIFSADPFDEAKLREIIAHVKEDSLENFIFEEKDKGSIAYRHAKQFLEQYLQVRFVVMDAEQIEQNSLLTLSPYLDAMELMKTFPPDETGNPFKKLFDENKNAGLKKSALLKEWTEVTISLLIRRAIFVPLRKLPHVQAVFRRN